MTTLLGTYEVRPVGAPVALGSMPIQSVRRAIAASLESFARAQAFGRWTIGVEKHAQNVAICHADDLPEPSEIDFAQFAPFLQVQ